MGASRSRLPRSVRRRAHIAAKGLVAEYGCTMLSCCHGRVPSAFAPPPQRSTIHRPSCHTATAAPVPRCSRRTAVKTSRTGSKRGSTAPSGQQRSSMLTHARYTSGGSDHLFLISGTLACASLSLGSAGYHGALGGAVALTWPSAGVRSEATDTTGGPHSDSAGRRTERICL